MKPKLSIHVASAKHFLSWELPYFHQYFEVVSSPASDSILFVFGPDALASGAFLPARFRVALLFPGFGYNPYHNLVHRYGMQKLIEEHYDLVFVNPGPIHEAFSGSQKLRLCPFSINTDLIKFTRSRISVNNLIHISANYTQKDWTRSRDVMQLTGLNYEVYPSRELSFPSKVLRKLRLYLHNNGYLRDNPLLTSGYESHGKIIKRYNDYDGFVHIARELPPHVDGKYTATLLEAGLTGCILFWHDTLQLGNDFETIFSLPLDPQLAASEILDIRKNINVERHSKLTSEEIYSRANPESVMRIRFEAMKEML